MAYTLFPKTKADIIKNCSKDPNKAGDIVELFSFLKKKFKQIDTPINIDVGKLGVVNVSRELQGMVEIKDIIREAQLTQIKIKFGAGSAGNRGVKNRGNLFENAFANGIRSHWYEQKKPNDISIAKAVVPPLAPLFISTACEKLNLSVAATQVNDASFDASTAS